MMHEADGHPSLSTAVESAILSQSGPGLRVNWQRRASIQTVNRLVTRMSLQRWTMLTAASLMLAVPTPAQSQQLAPRGVTRHDNAVAADTLLTTAPEANGSRLVGAANGALIGAGVGAFGGFFTAAVLSSRARDHSEDGLAFIALATVGAFVGLVSGAIIGAVVAR